MEEVLVLLPVVALALLEEASRKVLVEEVKALAQLVEEEVKVSAAGTALPVLFETPAPIRRPTR